MNMHADIDFAAIAGAVARELLGEPNPALSSAVELRFGSRGSLSVDLKKATFFDHEQGTGGGMITLIARETGCTDGQTFNWLRKHGFAPAKPEPKVTGEPRIVATYDYKDETEALLFQVCRFEPKDFRQRRPDGRGRWTWKLGDVRRVLYRLPELLAAPAGHLVFVCEGEEAVNRLVNLGFMRRTASGGANRWHDDYAKALQARGAR